MEGKYSVVHGSESAVVWFCSDISKECLHHITCSSIHIFILSLEASTSVSKHVLASI